MEVSGNFSPKTPHIGFNAAVFKISAKVNENILNLLLVVNESHCDWLVSANQISTSHTGLATRVGILHFAATHRSFYGFSADISSGGSRF